MDFLELTKKRYSCRAYQPRNVEKEKLDYVLECARFAPSAVNRQPWRFRIIADDESKAKLQQCYSRNWFKTAPLYIMASVLHDEEWVRADGKPHGNIDIAIAVEHLCLAATEQGLGTCWVCNFDAVLCKDLFALPESEEPAVIIPLGYSAHSADTLTDAPAEPSGKKRKAIGEIAIMPSK